MPLYQCLLLYTCECIGKTLTSTRRIIIERHSYLLTDKFSSLLNILYNLYDPGSFPRGSCLIMTIYYTDEPREIQLYLINIIRSTAVANLGFTATTYIHVDVGPFFNTHKETSNMLFCRLTDQCWFISHDRRSPTAISLIWPTKRNSLRLIRAFEAMRPGRSLRVEPF